MNYSIIIFFFNEEGTIQEVFFKTKEFLERISSDFEIILIDDGSSDASPEIGRQLEVANACVRFCRQEKNLGIGMALKQGYRMAQKEYVCAIPGDGQFNIEELKVVKPFGNNRFYSFYRPETKYNFYRSALTWFNRFFNQHVLAVFLRDVNWIKVYRNEQLAAINPKLNSSLIESEICSKLYKKQVMPIEIPSEYLPRQSGEAKGGNWRTLSKAIKELFFLWWEVKTFKI